MGFTDVWNRTLVYFGIAEEDEDWDEDGYVTNEELERSYSERPNVRRLSLAPPQQGIRGLDGPRAEGGGGPDRCSRPRPRAVQSAPAKRPCASIWSFRAASTTRSRSPTSSRKGPPVILNLQGSDPGLSKRLIDFAQRPGLWLDGGMQRVAEKVFLLTPRNVEASADDALACSSAAASSTRHKN